jgi:cytoskeleton protein RodZ
MPTIGETLREARMRQRLDIADVEARTKIRAKYLRALENEEFGLLPGSTFVKTFLRTYAELLGLDAHRLVEEYRANYEEGDDLELQPLATPAAPGRRERERRRPPGPPSRIAVLAGAIVVVLAFLIVLGLTGEEEGDSGEGETAAERTDTERRESARRRRQKRKPAAASVTLQIAPDGPTYVCLDRGTGTDRLFEGTISEPQTFKGRKLRLNLGRTSVKMRVNGRDFPVEPASNPVGYEFSPSGSKSLPPEQRPCVMRVEE